MVNALRGLMATEVDNGVLTVFIGITATTFMGLVGWTLRQVVELGRVLASLTERIHAVEQYQYHHAGHEEGL